MIMIDIVNEIEVKDVIEFLLLYTQVKPFGLRFFFLSIGGGLNSR